MTRRTVQTLAAIVVGLVLLLFVLRSADRDESAVSGRLLLPGFEAVANAVTNIDILAPDAERGVTILRSNDAWRVGARHDYPADVAKLRQLVIALSEARIVEEKTSNPEYYGRLAVDDPEAGGAGTRVTLSGDGFAYAVVLGDSAQGDNRYARIAGEATSYMIDRNPELPAEPTDWLNPDVVDVASEDVQRVTITHADGETIVVEKSDREQTDFDVTGIPEGRELSYRTVGNGIAGALSRLELDDVRAAVASTPSTTVVYETWDGMTLTARITADDDATHWVSIAAEAAGDDSAATERAAAINARVSGWEYRFEDYKKNLLTRRWDDMLKAADAE